MVEKPVPIDPTKNVLDLVQAAIRRQDDLRDAETRRINELAMQRRYYEEIIEGMRANSLKLLAEQLREHKADSGGRTALLEQFRWETGGKGTGVNAAAGWVLSLILAGISVAMYFKH
jgi:hypothetical protein